MLFVDTNVFIAFLTNAPPDHGQQALDFFQSLATGEITAVTTEGVLVEMVQVLSSKRGYAYPRGDISREVSNLLQLRGLRIDQRDAHLRALARYASTNLDYTDCLLIEYATESGGSVVSFDRDFDRAQPGIRIVPASDVA